MIHKQQYTRTCLVQSLIYSTLKSKVEHRVAESTTHVKFQRQIIDSLKMTNNSTVITVYPL